jgi:hypothetical protein
MGTHQKDTRHLRFYPSVAELADDREGGLTSMVVPSGTEAARAFIPAMDFDSSKAF